MTNEEQLRQLTERLIVVEQRQKFMWETLQHHIEGCREANKQHADSLTELKVMAQKGMIAFSLILMTAQIIVSVIANVLLAKMLR